MGSNPLLEAALAYASRGWRIFPCWPGMKKPLTGNGVKAATTDEATIRAWWTRWPDANIALACGPGSGIYVVDVDVDPDKIPPVDGWSSLKAFEPLPFTVRQNTPRGGAHYLFRSEILVRNKNSLHPGIDIRGEGYYVMLAPSLHPNGKMYAWETGLAPGEIELAEFPDALRPPEVPRTYPWDKKPATPPPPPPKAPARPSGTPIIERARLYLEECEPAVEGQAGHDKLLWAARSLVVGFMLDEATANELLWSAYNPRCIPPWDRNNPDHCKDFERKAREANRTPGQKPPGWLLDELGLRGHDDALLAQGTALVEGLLAGEERQSPEDSTSPEASANESEDESANTASQQDPGQIPDPLMKIPGFMTDYVEHCLKIAHCPNRPLAFAGGLALLSFLTGRKYCDQSNGRTNLYITALAHSSAGKDTPRRLNIEIIIAAGYTDSIGDRFGSYAGLEDALSRNPCMLYQTDEIDSLLRTIALGKDTLALEKHDALLRLFSASSSVYPRRCLAGMESRGIIDHPHLVLFGTAIPPEFYAALSDKMLSGGLVGRSIIIDGDIPRVKQRAKMTPLPDSLLSAAKWFCNFHPGGNLAMLSPVPYKIPATPEADTLFDAFTVEETANYNSSTNAAFKSIWGRAVEQAGKMAMLYAVSVDYQTPVITEDAARWAIDFQRHQIKKMLFMISRYSGAGEFEKSCRKVLAKLESVPGRRMDHSAENTHLKVSHRTH